MGETKRIMISLPQKLLMEVDGIVALENRTRSEFIREAMKLYLQERKKRQIRERMQSGYLEMAKINLTLSKEAIYAENEADRILEELVSGE
ncbi:MAG: ribbon-helix-helix protein, CopG family [Dethiobacteria bacterium]|jgi:CopG family transcriptional regulator/antitoxin EndoAI|nr:ribbon-helix-helix protein, CopG family [Bacillota bacterium]NMD33983.1 ribbon-helix-helix protein, CopG family [Bacillota bacterium]HOB28717.1 ribbon-helix-helix protein, CopG family [Bacillota bacterium]HPZ41405.1 ribbon-helix-helix protein, CopG family [Bacillota bacterium]HQD51672.1 ribbon-helix-helix protein, CopG family [Bacillota bacterium]